MEPATARRLKGLALVLAAVLALGGWFGWRKVSDIIHERQLADARAAQALKALKDAQAAAASLARRSAEMLIADGGGAFEARQYEDALGFYERAVATDPGFADTYLSRGNARLALQRFDDAEADYDLALAKDPDLAEAYLARGTLAWTVGRLEDAERDFAELTRRRPESSFYASRYALVLYDEDKKQAVRDFYQRALDQDASRDWAAGGLLGAVGALEDDAASGARAKLAKARELWDQGVHTIDVRYAIGDGLFQGSDYAGAIEWLSPLLDEDPNEVPTDAARNLAAAYRASGQVDQCVDVWRRYLDLMGRSAVFAEDSVRASCQVTS